MCFVFLKARFGSFFKGNDIKTIKYSDIFCYDSLKEGVESLKVLNFTNPPREFIGVFSKNNLQILLKELETQKYNPRPKKEITILKSNGRNRLFSISSQRDLLVQFVLFIHLKRSLEPYLYRYSFGGWPGKNCHDVLKNIRSRWKTVNWVIQVDIKHCFDVLHHRLLLTKLREFCDSSTTELIAKFLKKNYIDISNLGDPIERGKLGIPKGSPLSYILADLYLYALDDFVNSYIKSALIKEKDLDSPSTSLHDFNHSQAPKLLYLRYFDEILLGFSGSKKDAEGILLQIGEFCGAELRLALNRKNSRVVGFNERGIFFLGFYIRRVPSYPISRGFCREGPLKLTNPSKSGVKHNVQLRVPVEILLNSAVEKGYAKIRKGFKKSIRATSYRRLTSLDAKTIEYHFSKIIHLLLDYYSSASQLSDLWSVVSLYKKSYALTLAEKYKKKTAAAIFKRYGSRFEYINSLKAKKSG